MDDPKFNPYSPPEAGQEFDSGVAKRARRPIYITTAAAFVAIGFSVFTVLLLTADSADDVKGGEMFVLNVPILWSAAIFTSRPRIAAWLGLLGAGFQVGITVVMLWLSIGGPFIVLAINCAIVIPLVAVAVLLFRFQRNQADR